MSRRSEEGQLEFDSLGDDFTLDKKEKYQQFLEERERHRNRQRYPRVAEIIDEVRKSFPKAEVTAVRPMAEAQLLTKVEQLQGRATHGLNEQVVEAPPKSPLPT